MSQQHPITPPPELVREWHGSEDCPGGANAKANYLCTQAAQGGADMELEACLDWLYDTDCEDPQEVAQRLRAARRPKPPSLKEQALEAQRRMWSGASNHDDWDLVRRALEALDD